MPQYRKLYVKIVESLDVNDMPDDFTRLLWVLLPLALCREGRGIDNPRWLQSRLFPLRADVTAEQIQAAFNWLCERGMVVRFADHDRNYFYLPNWTRYQGNTEREAPSNYPPPPAPESVPACRPTEVIEPGGDGVGVCREDGAGKGREDGGGKGREDGAAPSAHRDLGTGSGPAPDSVATGSGPEAAATAEAGQGAAAPAAPAGPAHAVAADEDGAVDQLVALGVEPAAAATLGRQYPAASIRGWIDYARTQTRLRDPAGFVISRLQRGLAPPAPPSRTRRYTSGPYADLIES